MEQDSTLENYRHAVKFWFLQRCAHLLRNEAILSLAKKHILANLRLLPQVLLWLTSRGLTWREGADTSAAVEVPPPQNAFCLLLTWISDQPLILWHLSLGVYFHNIFISFVYMFTISKCKCMKLCSWGKTDKNSIFFTCLRPSLQSYWTLRVSNGSCRKIQEAQLWFQLALVPKSMYMTDSRNV